MRHVGHRSRRSRVLSQRIVCPQCTPEPCVSSDDCFFTTATSYIYNCYIHSLSTMHTDSWP